ncbi:MAG: lipid IV(A) palmitoyltransferase PagP [Herbaspirillum sp.]
MPTRLLSLSRVVFSAFLVLPIWCWADGTVSIPVSTSSVPTAIVSSTSNSVTDSVTTSNSAPVGYWGSAKQAVQQVWDSDQYELYIPAHTWHNRHFYTPEKIASYNENPWGIGFGKYRYDTDGNWHALYAMAFMESHNTVEPIVGYAYQKMWHPAQDLRVGAGFSVGVTMRSDYNYLPIPVLLPIASIEYGRFAIQTTYIPGGHNNGNVLFTWLRWRM